MTETLPDFAFTPALRREMEARLARFTPVTARSGALRLAAVAILVAPGNTPGDTPGEAGALVTLRPTRINRHSGQYALPGGRLDPGETPLQAAIRETREELGLTLTEADLIGRLDDYPTRSGFAMIPHVFWCDDISAMRPDPSEVAQVHSLPLSDLNSDDIPLLDQKPHSEHPVLSAYFPTLGHVMYAPTAAVFYQFREVALRGRETRVAHYDQPEFAWK
ncbi:MAG: CoA pyrophosphatase [Roseovarius sp.]